MHAKTAGRLAGFTWLVVAFVFANTTGPLAVTPASAVDATAAQPEYSEDAAAQAQEHLDRLYRRVSFDASGGMIRPIVHVVWNGHLASVEPLVVTDNEYSGRLRWDTDAGSKGQVIEFRKEHVIDWKFKGPNFKTYGDFQTRAKLPLMSETSAWRLGGHLSASPVPAGW